MIPTFEQSPSASTELVHFQQALIHSGMIDQFVNTGSPTQLQSYVDVSLPSYLCVNISYYDDTNVYQDSLLKTGCDSQNLKTVLYGTFYSDDIYILKLEGWYE